MPHDLLISAAQLRENLTNPGWVVFDCRHQLFKPDWGKKAYQEGHIPGARFAHSDEHLADHGEPGQGRHPLPDEATFSQWLAAQGVSPHSQVVAYDADSGSFASRLWFMLKAMGHQAVAVLDGGLAEWLRQGLPLTPDAPVVTPGNFAGRFDRGRMISLEELLPIHKDPALLLIDARGAARFEGKEEPLDPVAGHIPGAINAPSSGNTGPDGRFLPPAQLRARFKAVEDFHDPRQVIHYCGSGVSACHNLLATTLAGFPQGRVYVGSWSQWCADPSRPVATGPKT